MYPPPIPLLTHLFNELLLIFVPTNPFFHNRRSSWCGHSNPNPTLTFFNPNPTQPNLTLSLTHSFTTGDLPGVGISSRALGAGVNQKSSSYRDLTSLLSSDNDQSGNTVISGVSNLGIGTLKRSNRSSRGSQSTPTSRSLSSSSYYNTHFTIQQNARFLLSFCTFCT